MMPLSMYVDIHRSTSICMQAMKLSIGDKESNLSKLLPQVVLQASLDGRQVLSCCHPTIAILLSTSQCQILGHDSINVNSINTRLLQSFCKCHHLRCSIQSPSLNQASRPGKNRRNRVRRSFLAFLMLAVMSCHRTVRGFGLEGLAVRSDENRCHQSKGPKALSNDVRLHVTIVVYVTVRDKSYL